MYSSKPLIGISIAMALLPEVLQADSHAKHSVPRRKISSPLRCATEALPWSSIPSTPLAYFLHASAHALVSHVSHLLVSIFTIRVFSANSSTDFPLLSLSFFLSSVFLTESQESLSDELSICDMFFAINLDSLTRSISCHKIGKTLPENFQRLIFPIATEQSNTRQTWLLNRKHFCENLNDGMRMMPLFLICHHKSAEQIAINVRLRKNSLCYPVNL